MILSYIRIFGILAVIGSIVTGYFYVTGLQKKVEVLTSNNLVLQKSFEEEKQNFDLYKDSVTKNLSKYKEKTQTLGRKYDEAKTNVTRLEKTLSKHDLEYLAKKKPVLVEHRINSATSRLFKDIETFTSRSYSSKP